MKVQKLRCPYCKAPIDKINIDINEYKCEYCDNIFKLENENETKAEKIIKTLGKEINRGLEKRREYYSSNEYKKRLEIERKAKMIQTIFEIIIFGIIGIIIYIIIKPYI